MMRSYFESEEESMNLSNGNHVKASNNVMRTSVAIRPMLHEVDEENGREQSHPFFLCLLANLTLFIKFSGKAA